MPKAVEGGSRVKTRFDKVKRTPFVAIFFEERLPVTEKVGCSQIRCPVVNVGGDDNRVKTRRDKVKRKHDRIGRWL